MIKYFTVLIYNGFDCQLDVECSKRCLHFDVHLKRKYCKIKGKNHENRRFVFSVVKYHRYKFILSMYVYPDQ